MISLHLFVCLSQYMSKGIKLFMKLQRTQDFKRKTCHKTPITQVPLNTHLAYCRGKLGNAVFEQWLINASLTYYPICNRNRNLPFHPRVTAVARKRSRSFCQKCTWQFTAKHAYTLCMWLCMKWHGAWLYGVHRSCAETAAVSCGTSHASAVSTDTTSVGIQKTRYKASHSCRTTCERSESTQESGE